MKNTIMQNISKILLILISILFLYETSYASDDVKQKTHKHHKKHKRHIKVKINKHRKTK